MNIAVQTTEPQTTYEELDAAIIRLLPRPELPKTYAARQMNIESALAMLRTSFVTIYDYLIDCHTAEDADGFVIAQSALESAVAHLTSEGYKPFALFTLAAEHLISRNAHQARLGLEE